MVVGGGGGSFYLGIMTTLFGLGAATAASTSLVTSLPPLLIGAISYYRQRKINLKIGLKMLLYSIPAVIIGSILAHYIPSQIYSVIIGIILLALGIQLVYKAATKNKKKNDNKKNNEFMPVLFGSLGGLMCGISGLSGGGPIMSGLLFMGLDFADAAATSTFTLMGMIFIGLLGHLNQNIAWGDGVGLMIGALIGAFIMPIILSHLNQAKVNRYMTPILGILLVFMGLKNFI